MAEEKVLDQQKVVKFYSREDVQEAMIKNAEGREVAVKFGGGGFGKRPDILQYPNDILELARQGATSFHGSEEIWHNPLLLNPGMRKQEQEANRKAWDLVLDIDSDYFEYSKIAADLIIKAIKYQGIKNVTCKFSGRAGFHIGVSHKSFPETVTGKETRTLFPEAARKVAMYLREMIREPLSDLILQFDSLPEIMKKTEKKQEELTEEGKFNPFALLDIDTILISSRHLYRMPYSFNEKSGLISVVLDPDKVLEFELSDAEPTKVKVNEFGFLDKGEAGEASQLLTQAMDYEIEKDRISGEKEDYKEIEELKEAIPQKFFPPCIQLILQGLKDGKKRASFVLVNFLTTVGWGYDEIDKLLEEWNKKNPDPLREVIIKGQTRYHKTQKKRIMPPNCNNQGYYKGMEVCKPDPFCRYVKNPAQYAKKKAKQQGNQVNKKVKKVVNSNKNKDKKE